MHAAATDDRRRRDLPKLICCPIAGLHRILVANLEWANEVT